MPTWWRWISEVLDPVLSIATLVMLAYGLSIVIQINRRNQRKDGS